MGEKIRVKGSELVKKGRAPIIKAVAPQKEKTDRFYLNKKEAAAYLGVSVPTLNASDAPFHRIGTRSIRYDKRELEAWIHNKET